MRYRLFLRTVIILLATWLPACSKLISDEFPEFYSVPTVNTLIIAGDTIMVHVSMAEKIDTSFLTLIDNATVIISSGEADRDTLELLADGLYVSDIVAQQGSVYSIQVNIDGFDKIYGLDTVPTIVPAKIYDHTNTYRYSEDGYYMEGLGVKFYDDPSSVDYYELAIIRDNYSYQYFVGAYDENSEIILNEGFEPYTTSTLVFSDHLIKDSLVHLFLDFNQEQYSVHDYGDSVVQYFPEHKLILELRHVSEGYYHYKKSFYLYEQSRYTEFIEGTASTYPLFSNMENAYGIIGSYIISRDSIIVPGESIIKYSK